MNGVKGKGRYTCVWHESFHALGGDGCYRKFPIGSVILLHLLFHMCHGGWFACFVPVILGFHFWHASSAFSMKGSKMPEYIGPFCPHLCIDEPSFPYPSFLLRGSLKKEIRHGLKIWYAIFHPCEDELQSYHHCTLFIDMWHIKWSPTWREHTREKENKRIQKTKHVQMIVFHELGTKIAFLNRTLKVKMSADHHPLISRGYTLLFKVLLYIRRDVHWINDYTAHVQTNNDIMILLFQ